MSRNISDSKQERELLNRIARLERQMRERGTLQVQGIDATPQTRYGWIYGNDGGLFRFTTTVAAGGYSVSTIAARHSYPDDSIIGISTFEPGITLYVDTDGDNNYLWPLGKMLSAGQKKTMVSIVRDPGFGLTPQDPQNNAVYHIQIHNLDSAAHTYYGYLTLHGDIGLDPFISMI